MASTDATISPRPRRAPVHRRPKPGATLNSTPTTPAPGSATAKMHEPPPHRRSPHYPRTPPSCPRPAARCPPAASFFLRLPDTSTTPLPPYTRAPVTARALQQILQRPPRLLPFPIAAKRLPPSAGPTRLQQGRLLVAPALRSSSTGKRGRSTGLARRSENRQRDPQLGPQGLRLQSDPQLIRSGPAVGF